MIRLVVIGVLGAVLAACGGSGGDDPPPAAPPGPAPATVTVSGKVTFDFVPAVRSSATRPFGGLDYTATVARPARGVTVELLQGQTVAASTLTDAAGDYSFDVAVNTEVALRVRAEMLRVGTPSWDFRVVDNVNGNALYTLAGTAFNTGAASATRNLHAPSGWGGASYTSARSAAPFAILDVVYDAVQLALTAAPSTNFPALRLHWSTQNVPAVGTAPGEIGSSRYRPGDGIYLVGAANQDTDEYDRHVIAHEWGHYLEDEFSRSDSIGGPHTLTDQLDMRLAFGEAFGNAFAAMVTGESVYVDAHGSGQNRSFSFDLEQTPNRINPNPGWFNEESLQSLLYDLYDDGRDQPPGTQILDDLELGFAPIFAVLTGPQRTTRALTSVFAFIHGLKSARPADQPLIDALTASQRIATITDEYGVGQTNIGSPTGRTEQQVRVDFSSAYTTLTVGGPAVNVCSLDDYTSQQTGAENKLASRRFVRFTVTSAGPHLITARAVAPLNAPADPDLWLHVGGGQIVRSDDEPNALTCTINTPQGCVETFTQALSVGDHVLEVFEWTNTNKADDSEYPPIGRTCFDVTVVR